MPDGFIVDSGHVNDAITECLFQTESDGLLHVEVETLGALAPGEDGVIQNDEHHLDVASWHVRSLLAARPLELQLVFVFSTYKGVFKD